MHNLYLGDRVYHRYRHQYGTFEGLTVQGDVWVRFDGEPDSVLVARELLSKVAE